MISETITPNVGKSGFFFYRDFSGPQKLFGKLISVDETFVSVESEENIQLIRIENIIKIKIRKGDTNGKG